VGQAEAGAGLVGQQIENARIEAPIAGVIVKRMVQLGGMVGPQAPAFTIQDTSSLKIEASVESSVFLRLQKGAPAAISADGMAGKTFSARVSVLAPTLDPASRRAAVELALDPGTQLIPNMFVRASVAVGRVPGARTIPREAVLDRAGNTVVYKVVDGRAVAVPLRLGPSDGARIAVEEGLAPGDNVVVGGLGQLSDGAAVRVNSE
jgi:RND family efflux transporter MFP subunit